MNTTPDPCVPDQRLCVLVVDDDPLVLMGTVEMIQDLGYRVIEASSGAEALERMSDDGPADVLLTDQAMPGMTGVQLAAAVREKYPHVGIVLATGYAELPPDAPPDMRRLGKPFSQSELTRMLAACTMGRDSNEVPFRPA